MSFISQEAVEKIAATLYGFNNIQKIKELGSCQDANFRIDTDTHSYVLKISNLDASLDMIEVQNTILKYLESVKEEHGTFLLFPCLITSVNKEYVTPWKFGSETYFIRCFTYVDGIMLSDCNYLSLDIYEKIGTVCYQVDNLLSRVDFSNACAIISEAANTQWDMQFAFKNLESYISLLVPTPSLDVLFMHDLLKQA